MGKTNTRKADPWALALAFMAGFALSAPSVSWAADSTDAPTQEELELLATMKALKVPNDIPEISQRKWQDFEELERKSLKVEKQSAQFNADIQAAIRRGEAGRIPLSPTNSPSLKAKQQANAAVLEKLREEHRKSDERYRATLRNQLETSPQTSVATNAVKKVPQAPVRPGASAAPGQSVPAPSSEPEKKTATRLE